MVNEGLSFLREEVIMVNRILRDDPTKSSMHNREGLSVTAIAKAVADWRMWPLYILGLTHMSTFPSPVFAQKHPD